MSRPVLYLHIGMNKTGSTALQTYMSRHYSDHLQQSVLYPDAAKEGHAHYLLSSAFGYGINRNLRHEYDLQGKLQEILQEQRESGAKRIIMSSETFIVSKNPMEVRKGLEQFDVKIIVYLRRHDQWIESLYNQAVKMVVAPSWGRGINSYLEFHRSRQHAYFRYLDFLDRWANAFGEKNIIVRPFERSQMVAQDLVADFLDILGLDSTLYEAENILDAEANTSLPADRLPMIDLLQHQKYISPENKRRLVRRIGLIPPRRRRKYVFSPEERRQLVLDNQQDYDRIAEKYLRQTRLFHEPLLSDTEDWQSPERGALGSLIRFTGDLLVTGSKKLVASR